MRPEFNFVASQSLPSFWMSTPSSFSTSELSAPPRMAGLGSADASDGDTMNRNHMAIVVVADDLGDSQFLFVSIAITAIHFSRHFCGCTHPRPESLSCNDHVEIISRHFVPVIGAFDRVITATIPRFTLHKITILYDDQHRPVPHWLKYCNPLLGRSPSANWRDERRSATTARPRLLLEPGGECRRARNCAKM